MSTFRKVEVTGSSRRQGPAGWFSPPVCWSIPGSLVLCLVLTTHNNHITPVPPGDYQWEKKSLVAALLCQIRFLSWFELDKTASQSGGRSTSKRMRHLNQMSPTSLCTKTQMQPPTLFLMLRAPSFTYPSRLGSTPSSSPSSFFHQPWQLYNLRQPDLSSAPCTSQICWRQRGNEDLSPGFP